MLGITNRINSNDASSETNRASPTNANNKSVTIDTNVGTDLKLQTNINS